MEAQLQKLLALVSKLWTGEGSISSSVSHVVELKVELIPFLKQDSLGAHLNRSCSATHSTILSLNSYSCLPRHPFL